MHRSAIRDLVIRGLFVVVPVLVAVSVLVVAGMVEAQEHPLWMRYPAISPDGQQIAFCYQGDIYIVPEAGGVARAVVTHDAYDFHPVWSPDGKTIAFASDRNGNFDIYTVPASGGVATRLTYHTANEIPTCFTPDGKSIVFYASRMDDVKNSQFPVGVLPELYSIGIDGANLTQILTTPAQDAQYDHAGSRILYHDRKGYENEWRKHHKSAIARDVWMYDVKTGKHTKLTSFEGEDRNPVWSPDEKTVFYLSEQSGSFNVWSFPLDHPEQAHQITEFTKNPVRFLSMAQNGTIAFGFDGEIYVDEPAVNRAVKVNISIPASDREADSHFLAMNMGATELAVSPNGKEIAFIDRGDVFVTSIDYGVTKQITKTPEQERNVSFSPDGRSLMYASERGTSWKIYQTSLTRKDEVYFYKSTLLKEEPLISTEKETFQPSYSPDGKEIAYLEERTTLKVMNVKSKESRTILAGKFNYSYADGDQWYQWSPDGKWFLVTFIDHNRWVGEVGLVPSDGSGTITNLTNSGYDDGAPRWGMDGKMLYWFTDRNGLGSHGGGGEQDVYGMFFTQDAFDHFKMSREDFDLLRERERHDEEDKNRRAGKLGMKDTAQAPGPHLAPPLTINLKNIDDRIVRLSSHSSRLSDAVMSRDGEKLYYLSSFEKGADLWVEKIRDHETRLLLKLNANGGALMFDTAGKDLFLLTDGAIDRIDTGNGSFKRINYRAEMTLDRAKEREYMFEHAWRQALKKFYVEDMQGVDWSYYKQTYQKFLPYINNNFDWAEMMSEMLGELNASHTGSGYRPANPEQNSTASLGVFYDYSYKGAGLKIAEVIEKGPLDKAVTEIRAGQIIEKIDGEPFTRDIDFASLLNRRADKPALLSMYDPSDNRRWEEVVKPTSIDFEHELLYQRWVRQRRDEVDSLSHGKLGYVHVRGMGDGSYRDSYSEILGRNADRDGIIVDTRFNGGGWLHDDLATLLSGHPYVTFFPRHQNLGQEPVGKWYRKSCILVSESNYSDAHFFPYTYRALNIGKIIGMPVAGTATAVWWETLQDQSLYFGIPMVGMLDMQGKYLENQQLEPDVKINNDPESVAKGRDLQLEKAVEVMLEDTKK